MCRTLLKGGILSAILLVFGTAVSVAQAVRLEITGPSTMTAGSAVNLKITAYDASGKAARSYTGNRSLLFAGAQPSVSPQRNPTVENASGIEVEFGQPVLLSFDKGVAEVKGGRNGVMRLYRAEHAVISATDGTISTAGNDRLDITVNPTSVDHFSFSLTSPQRSGIPFTGTNTLSALDDYGNTVTGFNASQNPVTVTSSISGTVSGLGSGGNVLNRSSDFSSGVADLSGELTFSGSGSGTFTARSQSGSSGTSGSVTVNPSPPTATRLHIQTEPSSSVVAGIPFGQQPVIRIEDANGNLMSSDNSTVVRAERAAGTGTLQGTLNVTAVNGVATFTNLFHTAAGQITLQFSSTPSLTTETSTMVTVHAAPAATLAFEQHPSNSMAGEVIAPPVTVRGRDAFGNNSPPADAVTVTLSSGSGTLSGTTRRTADGNGLATFNDLSISEAGTKQLSAQSGSLPTVTSSTFTVAAPAARSIAATAGTPQSATVGTAFPTNLQCSVHNSNGDPASGITVTFRAPSTGASGTFAGNVNTAVTDANGEATAAVFTANSTSGSYEVTATAQGVNGSAIYHLTNLPAGNSAVRLLVTGGGGQSVQVGTAFTDPFVVEVRDQNNGPVGGVLVTFVAPSSGASGTFSGRLVDTVRTTTTGVAQASQFTANSVAGDYGVQASASGLSPVNIALTNSAGPLQSFSVEDSAGGPISTHAAGEPFAIRISARDQFGNVAQDFAGTVDVSSNGTVSAGQGRSAAFVGGILQSHSVTFASAGTFTITVQQTGGSVTGSSNSFSVVSPAPTVTSVMPASGARGDTLTVIVAGSGFVPNVTTVTFGDQIATNTTVLDRTRLQAVLSIDPNATAGPRDVSVVNPPPGGGTATLTGGFTVTAEPAATISGLTPPTGARLETMTVQIAGSHLPTSGGGVSFGQGILINSTASYGSSRLDANITILAEAATGTRSVRLFSSAGDTVIAVNAFTVVNPVPSLTSLVPGSITVGRDTTLVVGGDRFITGVTSLSFGTGITVSTLTVESATQMRARISVAPNAPLGQRPVVAMNSSPGGGVSSSIPLSVTLGDYPSTISVAGTIPFPSYDQPSAYSPTDYKLVGLPGASNNALPAYLPGSSGTDWQAYWDDGSSGSNYLRAYDGSSTFSFSVGRAFWLIKKQAWTFNVTVPSAQPDSTGCVAVPLHAGWNLITNPLPSSVPWTDIQNNNDSLSEPIFAFAGGFSIADAMDPFAGYYFFNNGQRMGLRIPVVPTSGQGAGKAALPAVNRVAGSDWRVTIRLTSGTFEDHSTVFGVAPSASVGLDPLDFRKPMRAPGVLPGLLFERPAWDPLYSGFGSDIRPGIADSGYTTWELQLLSKPGTPCVLSFEGLDNVPGEYSVVLINGAEASGQDLRKSAQYTFRPMTAQTPLRILVGAAEAVQRALEEVVPKSFALGNNYPNPFNPTTTIPVDLPARQDVELTVYNALGQRVAVLYSGSMDAGRHYITWNGQNASGTDVASGVYICRAVGSGVSAVRKMILLR